MEGPDGWNTVWSEGEVMDVQKLAEEIVNDLLGGLCVTGGSTTPEDYFRTELDRREKERREVVLRVKSMISDAMTPE